VGLAKTGKMDQVLAPLQHAAAGDFGKWGDASLEQPALQPFLATLDGQAWRRRVTQDREALVAALAAIAPSVRDARRALDEYLAHFAKLGVLDA
jgi:hypothetical protein